MSGTTDQPNEPTNNPELIRAIDQRITSLENPTSQRIGSWVLSESDDGNLIASHVSGGSVVLAKKPVGGENDPDKITDPIVPSVCATRKADFAVPTTSSNGGLLKFDGTSSESGGDWTGGKSDYTSVFVPVAGSYWVSATVHAVTTTVAAPFTIVIMVNGVGVATGASATADNNNGLMTGMTAHAERLLELDTGDGLSIWIVNETGLSWTVGTNPRGPGSSPCTLDAFLVTKKE